MFRTYQPKKRQRKKENGDRQRPQGSVPPQSEGQKAAHLLSCCA